MAQNKYTGHSTTTVGLVAHGRAFGLGMYDASFWVHLPEPGLDRRPTAAVNRLRDLVDRVYTTSHGTELEAQEAFDVAIEDLDALEAFGPKMLHGDRTHQRWLQREFGFD